MRAVAGAATGAAAFYCDSPASCALDLAHPIPVTDAGTNAVTDAGTNTGAGLHRSFKSINRTADAGRYIR